MEQAVIQCNGQVCKIMTPIPEHIHKEIFDACSERDPNHFKKPKAQRERSHWDGWYRLYSWKTRNFRAGLIPKIVKILFKHGYITSVKYDIMGGTELDFVHQSFPDREYQHECADIMCNNRFSTARVACLTSDTPVFGPNGMVLIKDLNIGDEIYDGDGSIKKIINIIKSNKKIIKLIGTRGWRQTCTADHPFIVDGIEVPANKLLGKTLDRIPNILTPKTTIIDMSRLITKQGKIVDDKMRISTFPRWVSSTLHLNDDIMWLYGLVVAEGYHRGIVLNKKERDIANRALKIYSSISNGPGGTIRDHGKNSIRVEFAHRALFKRIFFDLLYVGSGARNKSINFLFGLNKEFVRNAIRGMFDGDGCIRERLIDNKDYINLSYKTSSYKLAMELTYILYVYFGCSASVFHGMNKERYIDGRKLLPSDYYQVEIYSKDDILRVFPDLKEKFNNIDDKISSYTTKAVSIVEIEDLNITDVVYNITLENSSLHIFSVSHGVLTHNTGGGKTYISSLVTKKINMPTVFIVRSKDLLLQAYNDYKTYFPDADIKMVGDTKVEVGDITIVMIQSLLTLIETKKKKAARKIRGKKKSADADAKRDERERKTAERRRKQAQKKADFKNKLRKDIVEKAKLVHIDECHMLGAETIFKMVSLFNNAINICGWSATPRRPDGRNIHLEAAAGPVVYVKAMKELIKDGYLVPPTVRYVKVPPRLGWGMVGNVEMRVDEKYYNSMDYATLVKWQINENQHRHDIIHEWVEHFQSKRKSTLISVRHLDHGAALEHNIPESHFVHGTHEMRGQLLQDFKIGGYNTMSSTLCKEGFDAPIIEAIVIAMNTRDPEQIIGRGVRLNSGKNGCDVIHLVDDHTIFLSAVKACKEINNENEITQFF